MAMDDKIQGKAREMGGKMTGNKKMEMKGKAQQTMGDAKDTMHDMDEKTTDTMPNM